MELLKFKRLNVKKNHLPPLERITLLAEWPGTSLILLNFVFLL
jgi:hypothetical protein